MKTLKDLNKLNLTCMSLHIKNYNAILQYNKLYVIYDDIRFSKLSKLRSYIKSKKP